MVRHFAAARRFRYKPVLDLSLVDLGYDYAIDWMEGDGAVTVAPDAGVSNQSSAAISRLTIVAAGIQDAEETLVIGGTSFPLNADKTATATGGGTTFNIAFTTANKQFVVTENTGADAPLSDTQLLVRSITYNNTAVSITEGDRTFTFVARAGLLFSSPGVLTISVTADESVPILDLNGVAAGLDVVGAFSTGADATAYLASATITSSNPLTEMTIVGSGITDGADEVVNIGGTDFPLNADKTATGTAGSTTFQIAYTTATQTFDITNNVGGTMSATDAQSLQQGITYQNVAADPTTGNRVFTCTINDGSDVSEIATWTVSVQPNVAVLPTEYSPPAFSLPSGTAHFPQNFTELDTLLDGGNIGTGVLAAGDIIVIDPAQEYVGSGLVVPNLSPGAGVWTYMITKAEYDTPGTLSTVRLDDDDDANLGVLKTSTATNNSGPTIGLAYNATRWRFVGIKFQSNRGGPSGTSTQYAQFVSGYDGANTVVSANSNSLLPEEIILDRCKIVGRPNETAADWRGITLGCNKFAALGCVIDEIRYASSTSNECIGIEVWNGGSQYLFQDCFIAATGICFISGSAPSNTDTNPSDIVMRRCHLKKHEKWLQTSPSWNGNTYTLKNTWEVKQAERVLLENCVLENNSWNSHYTSQYGSCIVLTPRNQGNAPEAAARDITIRHNLLKNIDNPLRMSNQDDLQPSSISERVYMHDNLAIGVGKWRQSGMHLRMASNHTQGYQPAQNIRIIHNTFVAGDGGQITQYQPIFFEGADDGWDNTVIKANIFECRVRNLIGGTGMSDPIPVLNKWNVGYEVTNNVAFNEGQNWTYPAGNYTGTTINTAAVGFTDYAGGDMSLNPASEYAAGNAKDAYDDEDMGADVAAVMTAIAGVEFP